VVRSFFAITLFPTTTLVALFTFPYPISTRRTNDTHNGSKFGLPVRPGLCGSLLSVALVPYEPVPVAATGILTSLATRKTRSTPTGARLHHSDETKSPTKNTVAKQTCLCVRSFGQATVRL
jgi:hypothetical protein